MKVFHFFVFLFAFSFMACQPASNSENIDTVQVTEFSQMLAQPDVQLIDARTAKEYGQGHIEGAKNLDVLQPAEFEKEIQYLDKDKPVMVYCKSGKRSMKAAEILEENGFTEIINLDGGYKAWEDQNP